MDLHNNNSIVHSRNLLTLDHIDRTYSMYHGLDYLKENMDAYFDEAAKQGLTEEDAKKYLFERTPKTTFYRIKSSTGNGA